MQDTQTTPTIAAPPVSDFALVESILWEHCCGFWLLPEHLARLRSSAAHFSVPYDETRLMQSLDEIVKDLAPVHHRIRVLVRPDGSFESDTEPASEDRRPVSAAPARQCIDAGNEWLYHKTTRRQLYDEALTGMSGVAEVLLWNSRGELTESCTSNLVAEQDGRYYTPPVSCGLLPGTYRARLLQDGTLTERPIRLDDMRHYSKLYLINSVIGWREVKLVS